jgi:hypothetical protein
LFELVAVVKQRTNKQEVVAVPLLQGMYRNCAASLRVCMGGGDKSTGPLFVDVVPTARDDGFRIKTDKTSVLSAITKTFSQQQPLQNKHSPFRATLSTLFLRQADV